MYGVELRADGSRCARELGMTSWVPDAEMYNEMAATMSGCTFGCMRCCLY